MKIIVDELPESCTECLFFVPGEWVTKNTRTQTHCRLTRHVLLKSDVDKKRHGSCPLTTAGVNKK